MQGFAMRRPVGEVRFPETKLVIPRSELLPLDVAPIPNPAR